MLLETKNLESMTNKYLEHLKIKGSSKETIYNIISDITKYTEYLKNNESYTLNELESTTNEYITHLIETKKYKNSTLNKKVTTIKTFMNFNDIKLPKVTIPKLNKKLPNVLTEDEINTMCNTATGLDKLIIRLLYTTGLRVNEFINIKKDDVDYKERTITVFGKGNKERVVMYTDDVAKLLEKHKNQTEYLITNRQGKKLNSMFVNRAIKKVAKQSGITKNVTPHTLRHTFATMMLKKRLSIYDLQQLMGHTNINTTTIYLHTAQSELKARYDEIKL